MAKIRSQQSVLPSVLDRLIDEDPDAVQESARPVAVLLQDIKANIRRDLEWLLNTRLYLQQRIDLYPELKTSLVAYGLPDFSTVLLGSAEHRERFRLAIQDTIERFEPRLRRVQVEISPSGEEHDRTLYLKIMALLMVEPDPVPLLFDSRIRALERAMELRELHNG
jgi:type VI secretion system protein ImpF